MRGTGFLPLAALILWPFSLTAEEKPPIEAGAEVAVINIGGVFQKYQKALDFKAEMEETLRPFRRKVVRNQLETDKVQKQLAKANLQAAEKEALTQKIIANKKQLEDLDREARKMVREKHEKMLVELYQAVHQTTRKYAQKNGHYVVLGYGETLEYNLFNQSNIDRKMHAMDAGGLGIFNFSDTVDITVPVIQELNRDYQDILKKARNSTTGGVITAGDLD